MVMGTLLGKDEIGKMKDDGRVRMFIEKSGTWFSQ
jgi:hypothetical protein